MRRHGVHGVRDGSRRARFWGPWLLNVAVVALLAGLAACGGSGGGTMGPTSPTPVPTPTPTPTPTATPAATFQTSEYNRSDGPAFHNAIPAWQQGANGTGVTIGIVDSGIDPSNPEFAGRISAASGDVLAGSNRPLLNPDSDHGTDVALVAAAARNNAGIMGIAWNAQVLMARADDAGSCATKCQFDDITIAAGVDRAVANGAKVINLSLGGDPASATMAAAITRAAAAGVVVVVSAGNDATANPDPFATTLRAAGNGNVIIAGSVDSSGTISSFSDRAGTEAQWYLSALGEKVCCTYQNGAIKVTTTNGQTFVEVFSGTSFAAPQIAGAVALLRQAFPSMTAVQVVDLLLRTARDAGTSGTDSTYGRGILDIGAAFQPQGATSLAGTATAVALGASGGSLSAAMGDAGASVMATGVVLDGYGRAFRVNLAGGIVGAGPAARLAPSLAGALAATSMGDDRASLSYSIDAAARMAGLRWRGPLRLTQEDGAAARVLASRIVLRLAPRMQLAFATAQAADGIVAELAGASRPAFLIAGQPFAQTGFERRIGSALALRRTVGRWGITLSAESGQALAPQRLPGEPAPRDADAAADRFGVTLDRRSGRLDATLGASWLAEQRTVLGARFAPAFGAHGADTMLLDLGLGWQAGARWRLAAAWRQGWTTARTSALIAPRSRLVSDAWSIDATRVSLVRGGDSLSLRLAQPLRVEAGGLDLMLPTAWNYDTRTATTGVVPLALTPRGRELDAELAYGTPLAGGWGSASLFWRRDPGNRADLADDKGLGLAWKTGF